MPRDGFPQTPSFPLGVWHCCWVLFFYQRGRCSAGGLVEILSS